MIDFDDRMKRESNRPGAEASEDREASFDPRREEAFLDSLVNDYQDTSPYSRIKKEIILKLVDEFVGCGSDKDVLQMGCSNGFETELLAARFRRVDIVDGSKLFIERAKAAQRLANVVFKHSLFETMHETTPAKKYDCVFCHYVLEHVFDPPLVLASVRGLLKPDGFLFVVVPNSQAFSRQLALQLGCIDELSQLTENDVKHGHRRTYDMDRIVAELERSGFDVTSVQGIIFKILADFQLNRLLQDKILAREHIEAMQAMAQGANKRFSDSFFVMARSR